MSQAITWQCRKDPYRLTRGLKHWLALLLVLAFSTPGLAHVSMGDHAASATSLSLDVASIDQAVTAEPDCGHGDESHGRTCCTGSVCSYFVPPVSAGGTSMAMVVEVVARLTDEVHPGRAPLPACRAAPTGPAGPALQRSRESFVMNHPSYRQFLASTAAAGMIGAASSLLFSKCPRYEGAGS